MSECAGKWSRQGREVSPRPLESLKSEDAAACDARLDAATAAESGSAMRKRDLPRPQGRDRAHAASGTIIAIIVDALRAWLHGQPVVLRDVRAQVEALLRDEFDDLARQIRGERDVID
jgi:hypothetical protein